jgi:hypothetical protein
MKKRIAIIGALVSLMPFGKPLVVAIFLVQMPLGSAQNAINKSGRRVGTQRSVIRYSVFKVQNRM